MLYYSEVRHREFALHFLLLFEHVALSTSDFGESVTSKLTDILRYSGLVLRFLGKFHEEM